MVSARQTSEFIFFLTREYSLFISRRPEIRTFHTDHYTIMDQRIDCLGHQMFRVHGAKR